MAYVVVDNFSAGLDSRRTALTARPGTLQTIKNAHITRGGEIEKRKKFAEFANLPAGTFGMEAGADTIYVFGSLPQGAMPAGITYQRLRNPNNVYEMTKVVHSCMYGGLPFVIAEYQDGKRFCFWDGAIIKDWFTGIANEQSNTLSELVYDVSQDFDSTFLPGYSVKQDGDSLVITSAPGKNFTVSVNTSPSISSFNVKIVDAVVSQSPGAPSIAPNWFPSGANYSMANSPSSATLEKAITSIKCDRIIYPAFTTPGGVVTIYPVQIELLSEKVLLTADRRIKNWQIPNSHLNQSGEGGLNLILAICKSINKISSTTHFEALALRDANGQYSLSIRTSTDFADASQDKDVFFTTNNIGPINTQTAFPLLPGQTTPSSYGTPGISTFSIGKTSNGTDSSNKSQGQVTHVYFEGNVSPNDSITVTITETGSITQPYTFGATRVSGQQPLVAITHKAKLYSTVGPTLYFSAINDPTKWDIDDTGSGFINLSNNSTGADPLTGLAVYQSQLAAFSRRTVQMWSMDADPANNRQLQSLSSTGAISRNSIISVGDIDVFYLSDSGVRSLRARDSSNTAVVNDIGTPIDSLILEAMNGMTEDQKALCCAVVDPVDGRYWLAIGNKIFVFSYFPNGKVAAWSTYETGLTFSKFTTKQDRVYCRAGNKIYLYGGATGNEYDESEVEVVLPPLDTGKPAHQKRLNGIDVTVEGWWKIYVGMDPYAPEARDYIASVNTPTFSLGRVAASGWGTHIGIKMTCVAPGYARIGNIIAHFDLNEAD